MSDSKISRRDATRRALMVLGAAAVAPTALACGGGEGEEALSCNDTSGLDSAAQQLRQTQNYVEAAPNPAEKCSNCRFFQAPNQAGTCGTCTVLQGPIHPDGYCNLYAANG